MIFDYLNKLNSAHGLIYVSLRAIIIYVYAIFLFRIGNKRYHLETTFDFILILIIGSILSRAINGSSTLLQAIASSLVLIFLHYFFCIVTYNSHCLGKMIKGPSFLLIKDGKLNKKALQSNNITEQDLREVCREKLHHDDLQKIKEARLERTGRISFIKL